MKGPLKVDSTILSKVNYKYKICTTTFSRTHIGVKV